VIALGLRNAPVAARRVARRGLGVEQDSPDVDRAHAVDEAVMGLGGERPASFGEAVEQHGFPQRAPTVQPVRQEIAEPLAQLGVAARMGQRCVAHLRRDVEVRCRLPRGPRHSADARTGELLAVARQQLQPLVDVPADTVEVRRAAVGQRVEHHDRTEVHRRAVVDLFQVQEHGVQRAQSLTHLTHPFVALTRTGRCRIARSTASAPARNVLRSLGGAGVRGSCDARRVRRRVEIGVRCHRHPELNLRRRRARCGH
jgi:hypothetical protein